MVSRAEISLIRSLRQKKYRREHGLFVVEGVKLVEELIQSPVEITAIFHTQEWSHPEVSGKTIAEKELKRISNFKSPNKVLALARIPNTLSPIQFQFPLFCFEQLNDPGNLGTILRTLHWFGLNQLVCSPDSVDVYNPKVVQSSMGSVFHVQCIYQDLEELCRDINKPIYSTSLEGENLFGTEILQDAVFLFGSESHGLSEELNQIADTSLKIPGGETESLNLSIATGIVCGELFRRKKA